jgi:hypothetical protein
MVTYAASGPAATAPEGTRVCLVIALVKSASGRITTLVYILAPSHSGSTLLAMLLGAHPDVCTVGELKANTIGDAAGYLCSCGVRLADCAFWSDVQTALRRRGFDFDIFNARTHPAVGAGPFRRRLLRPLHRGPALEWLRDLTLTLSPGWTADRERVAALNAALVETICDRARARVIVDSSKIGLRLKYLLRNPALDVRVVRLLRDGRATALTYMDPSEFADASNPHKRGGGTGQSRADERLSMQAAAYEWRRSNEEADAIVRSLPSSRLRQVRYEAVCADPRGVVRELLTFAGVDPTLALPDYRSREHHVLGNGMRLDVTSHVRLDERWRSVLGPDALRTFDAVAGDLNRRLGYA